ncbi:uncharacterized protein T551_02752 [Pneumocystis jirovecii RU7]|uniref:GATA-type domain-containing protein n=1 Tax=Pneumocystis jirovecii (strain RU7) TaxID=1408657 RepID=A0A0W4ZIZ3_PNEJ7|nr:uncharacterized protein T551_02752 [Pneumocystis jirovecii RU7]KTW28333.1 hypothetical protein T551_02752 [Pneumocystis jirovecii RU7]
MKKQLHEAKRECLINRNFKNNKLLVKILYSFDEKHQMTCLAWHENPVSIEIVSLNNLYKEEVGIINLKTCILTVIAKSPELILQKGHDFVIYTLDPTEDKEVFSGHGMLSWVLDISLEIKSNSKNVIGKIKHLKKMNDESEVVLEIFMRLSKVPYAMQTNLLNTIQDFCFFYNISSPLVSEVSEMVSSEISEKNENTFFEQPVYLYNSSKSTNIENQNNFQKYQKNAFDTSQSSILLPFRDSSNVKACESLSPISFLGQTSSPISEPISPQIPSSSSSPQYQQLPPSSPPILSSENQTSYPTSEPSLSFPDIFETLSFMNTASNSQKFINYLEFPQSQVNIESIETKKDSENMKSLKNDIETFDFTYRDLVATQESKNNNETFIDELPERKRLNEAVLAAKLALESLSMIKLIDNQVEGNSKIVIDSLETYDQNNNKGNKSLKQSKKKVSNALRIEMNLLKSIQEGKIPNYCNNCGTIKTVSWRKVKTADGKSEETLCNPCGVWWSSHKSMRPSHLWRQEAITLNFHNLPSTLCSSKKTKRKGSYTSKNDGNLEAKTNKKYTGNKISFKKQKNTIITDRMIQSSPPKYVSQEIFTREPFSELNNENNWVYSSKKSILSTMNNAEKTIKLFSEKENKSPKEYDASKKTNISSNIQNNHIKTISEKNILTTLNPWKSTNFFPQSNAEIVDAFVETQKDCEFLHNNEAFNSVFLENNLTNATLLTSSTSLLKLPTDIANSKIMNSKNINLKESHKINTSSPLNLFIFNKDTQDTTNSLWAEITSSNISNTNIDNKEYFLENIEKQNYLF